jgi:ferritin-like protein
VRRIVHTGSATLTGKGTMSATGVVGIAEGASLDAKVEFLLRRSEEEQKAFGKLAQRVSAIEEDVPRRLAELRDEMTGHVATALAADAAEYRPLRIIGTVALAIGLGLATAGNLV